MRKLLTRQADAILREPDTYDYTNGKRGVAAPASTMPPLRTLRSANDDLRRYVLHVAVAGGVAGLIATRRAVAATCEQDRCRMEELLASGRVPASFKVLPLAASASWPCCCEPHPPLRPFPDTRRR